MGTIVERRRKNGSTAFMAKIILKREGKIAHRETETFDRRPAANAWIKKREEELSKPGAIGRVNSEGVTLAQAIGKFIADSIAPIGRTKLQVLNSIKTFEIAAMRCDDIASQHLVSFAQALARTRKPPTVASYLSHLATVFDVAGPAWDYPLDRKAMEDATIVARRLGLIGKGASRDRRPTLDEIDRVLTFFASRKAHNAIPMVKLSTFAIFSARRQREITGILWSDLDEEHSRVLVRDMKDPAGATGNHVWCDLPQEALRIVQAMPRTDDRIFPYYHDTVGHAWRDACQLLGIEDLHFHDLRHDGVSRLFELGFNIPHVAAVSGHRSWSNLKRYTHIRTRGDKYAGWKWLEIASQRSAATAP